MAEILTDMTEGRGKAHDIDLLLELEKVLSWVPVRSGQGGSQPGAHRDPVFS